jgi:hypothetical protein
MTFKPAIWYPIAVALSGLNLVGVWFAAQPAEPWHATIHAGLALGFGLWAQRLRRGPARTELHAPLEGLEVLEVEVSRLRDELSEAQERLDFTERMLAQAPEPRRDDQQR